MIKFATQQDRYEQGQKMANVAVGESVLFAPKESESAAIAATRIRALLSHAWRGTGAYRWSCKPQSDGVLVTNLGPRYSPYPNLTAERGRSGREPWQQPTKRKTSLAAEFRRMREALGEVRGKIEKEE